MTLKKDQSMRSFTILAVLALACAVDAAGATRLFILSGQSNMANLNPEEAFTPAVQKAFPGDEILVVKVAVNGQQIRMWLKDWKPPQGMAAGNKPIRTDGDGRLYTTLMAKVAEACKDKPKPATVTFVWMQGEADARAGYGAVYEESLRTLYKKLQTDLGRDDIGWVIGRISDYGNTRKEEEPDWMRIREIQVAVAESIPLAKWVDCDDLNGKANGLHLPPDGYKQLGERFAKAAVDLITASGKPAKGAN